MKKRRLNVLNVERNFEIKYIDHKTAKYAVQHWHYSKTLPIGKLVKFGIWEENKYIGCIVYSCGNCDALGSKYGYSYMETAELSRIALNSHETSVSKLISITLKMLRKQSSGLKLIVSYADTNQNHLGKIYQASNWIYDGTTKPDKAYKYNNVIYHSRHISGSGKKKIFNKIVSVPKPSECHIIQLKEKHKYLYPLTDEVRKNIIKYSKSYPKNAVKAQEKCTESSSSEVAFVTT